MPSGRRKGLSARAPRRDRRGPGTGALAEWRDDERGVPAGVEALRSHKRALAITLLSLVFWTAWNYARPQCHALADFGCGTYTDHFTHVGLARIFTHAGFEIYQGPRGELGRALTPDEQEALPEDIRGMGGLRTVEGWPPDKPFIATWPTIPSFYPPGDLVMFAPIALAYSFTGMSFTEMNLMTIQLLLVYAHLSLFLMLVVNSRRPAGGAADALAMVVAYFLIMRWTIEGFYDGGWIAPLVIAPLFLLRRAGLQTMALFALALFAHYRALFLLPWGVWGFVDFVRGREWRSWSWQKSGLAAATVVMGGLALATFLISRQAMSEHQMTNAFNPSFDSFQRDSLLTLALVTVPGAVLFVWRRAWLEVATLAWVFLLITQLPETYPWDAVALVPWLVAPALSRSGDDAVVRQVRTATVFLVVLVVFSGSLNALSLDWFRTVVDQLIP